MSESVFNLSSERFYQEAKLMLEKKDLLEFVSKISMSFELAGNDNNMRAQTSFLKIKGLFDLMQHKKVIENISIAMQYNEGDNILRLKNYEGVSYGYLGEVKKAEKVFREILEKTEVPALLIEAYLNIAWLRLSLDNDRTKVNEAKVFLDLANKYFDIMDDRYKRKLLNNYGVYYFYTKDYEKSIEFFNECFKYTEEKYFPKLYNNLAEVLMEYEKETVAPEVKEYTAKAETIATRYDDNLEMAKSFYTQAMAALREDQLFTALDILYLAFEHFKEAGADAYALKCMMKFNQLVNDYKSECMLSIQKRLENKFQDVL